MDGSDLQAIGNDLNVLYPARETIIRSARLLKLLDYWEQRRRDRSFPARADIDPIDMRFALGKIVLFDVLEAPQRFRFRLVGVEFTVRFGLDPTGMTVEEYPRPDSRASIIQTLSDVVTRRAPQALRRRVSLADRICAYDAVYLPLSSDGGRIDMLMMGFDFI